MTARPAPIHRVGLLTGGRLPGAERGDPGASRRMRSATGSRSWASRTASSASSRTGCLLGSDDVSNILTIGGTILGRRTRPTPERFAGQERRRLPKFQDMTDLCMRDIEHQGLDAVVVVGGDGTMTGAQTFTKRGVNCIGVPKTIDNDLHGTDLTFGFLTAVQIATDALDRVHTTAASHHRVMVVEVMGRNAGWIALHAGVASGADVILIPEINFDIDAVCRVCTQRSAG